MKYILKNTCLFQNIFISLTQQTNSDMKKLTEDEIFEQEKGISMFTYSNNGLAHLRNQFDSLQKVYRDCHERFVKENIGLACEALEKTIWLIEQAEERATEQRKLYKGKYYK